MKITVRMNHRGDRSSISHFILEFLFKWTFLSQEREISGSEIVEDKFNGEIQLVVSRRAQQANGKDRWNVRRISKIRLVGRSTKLIEDELDE